MDTIFSFNRIKQLGIRYFVENWKKDLLMGLIVLFVALISNIQNVLPYFIYEIFILVYAGTIFSNFIRSEQGIHYLMIPASTLEKFTVNAFLVHIYYTLGLVLFIVLGILFRVFIESFFVEKIWSISEMIHRFYETNKTIDYLSIFTLQALMMFGSIYFTKISIIKTLLSIAGFFFLLGLIAVIVFFSSVDINNMLTIAEKATISPQLGKMLKYLPLTLNIVVILYFWILSYFRLRETEA